MPISIGAFRHSALVKESVAASTTISHSAELSWNPIPNSEQALLRELQQLYWNSIERELVDIILTLKTWQNPGLGEVALKDEDDQVIYGFDTFLDQVNESSRDYALQYSREKAREMTRNRWGEYVPQDRMLQDIARKFYANTQSKALKKEIEMALEAFAVEDDIWRRRAKMLLLSAGWLDIDKFIEHRPPLDKMSFWKRPTTPQLCLQHIYDDFTPSFQPLLCTFCKQVIRGSFYQCVERDGVPIDKSICQNCHSEGEYRHYNVRKRYKHCVLSESIGPSMSRKICKCSTVSRYDADGQSRSLFPVDRLDRHRSTPKGTIQCGLLDLTSLVAEAKYESVKLKVDNRGNLEEERRLAREEAKRRESREKENPYRRVTTEIVDEKEAAEDVPFFMRTVTDRYPFGNVHMALRVGPLMIENGVPNTKGGALITSRDAPMWHSPRGSLITQALALSENRLLYSQIRNHKAKRYKTALKQVVGGLFSGLSSPTAETDIVDLMISASRANVNDEDVSPQNNKKLWSSILEPIMNSLIALMKPRVEIMLRSIVERLLDPNMKLHWDYSDNNCQNFCDNLIDHQIYGGLLSCSSRINPLGAEPLYLMSFVCRSESYQKERRVRTKFDVPSGLCEEYLLKFRYGFHVDSDLIDTLQEYWYDWGGFDGPLYRYQHLFPWDCTEAYSRSNTKCNDCNISKHVWSFPFDSWSIAELHLTRSRTTYPDISSEQEWMKNRLTVLLAQTSLVTAAKAMAQSLTFQKATAWLAVHPNPRIDRMKLGGIHRAQPFSHQYENGKYHEYFIADWAHLRREDQIVEYEKLRDARQKLPDMPKSSGGYSSSGVDSDGYDSDMGYFGLLLGAGLVGCFAFDPYFGDGWDGSYAPNETMPAEDAALIGTDDPNAGGSDFGGGDDGGGCGGGCGGD